MVVVDPDDDVASKEEGDEGREGDGDENAIVAGDCVDVDAADDAVVCWPAGTEVAC